MLTIVFKYVDYFLKLFAVLAIFHVVMSYVRVVIIERDLKIKYKELNNAIEAEKQKPVLQSIMDGRILQIKEKNKFIFEELERKRRYILDKIPFIK